MIFVEFWKDSKDRNCCLKGNGSSFSDTMVSLRFAALTRRLSSTNRRATSFVIRRPTCANPEAWGKAFFGSILIGGAIRLLMTKFIKWDLPFCLTRTTTRTVIGLCYTPLSMAPEDAPRRCTRSPCTRASAAHTPIAEKSPTRSALAPSLSDTHTHCHHTHTHTLALSLSHTQQGVVVHNFKRAHD